MLHSNRSFHSRCSAEMTCLCLLAIGLLIAGCGPQYPKSKPEILGRQNQLWDDDWHFVLGDPNGAEPLDFNDSDWNLVTLPHDWMIHQVPEVNAPSGTAGGYYPGGVGWYRKRLALDEPQRQRKVTLQLDGAYRQATVYVNNREVDTRDYGYLSVAYDLSRHLHVGPDNLIAIRVDASVQPMDRWYSGAGLFRHVHLSLHEPLYIPTHGVTVTTPWITNQEAQVKIHTQLRNDTRQLLPCRVVTKIIGPDNKVVDKLSSKSSLAPGSSDDIQQQTTFKNPKLWELNRPQLYRIESQVYVNKHRVDEMSTPFGIRSLAFKSDSGFWLNDQPVRLKGVCLHHDGGVLGAAVPKAVWKRRLEILKSMGVNALRLGHNPHAPEVLDLCDELGLLVIDELYDKWRIPWQTEEQWTAEENESYCQGFVHRWQQDLDDFIARDRNHPSVILWSVGNETLEQLKDPNEGVAILKTLVGRVHELDPTREVTCALHPHGEFPSRLIHHVDVVSYNYQTAALAKLQSQYPSYRWLASETKAVQNEAPADWTQVDFSKNSWFALNDGIAGQFIWSGIDYLGESPSWPSRGFPGGLLETTGFKKPHAYFTESLYRDDPMVHVTVMDPNLAATRAQSESWQDSWYGPALVEHWSFTDHDTKDVYVFTNAEIVELSLNGRSLGQRHLSDSPAPVLRWQVPYEAGTLKAVATQDGRVVAEHELQTAGPAHHLELACDRSQLKADGQDVAHIVITAVDKDGTPVPGFAQPIQVQVTDNGRLLGLDNGDLYDHTPCDSDTRKTRNGRSLAMVQSETQKGSIEVTVTAKGLPEATLSLKASSRD